MGAPVEPESLIQLLLMLLLLVVVQLLTGRPVVRVGVLEELVEEGHLGGGALTQH